MVQIHLPFVHLELVQVAATELCTPVVCTEERLFLVKMDFQKLTSLNMLPFLFY